MSVIWTSILSLRPSKCLSVYSYEYSLDLHKTKLFKKSIKLPARIFVPKSDKCIPSVHICGLEILPLKVKPKLFNTHCFLKVGLPPSKRFFLFASMNTLEK